MKSFLEEATGVNMLKRALSWGVLLSLLVVSDPCLAASAADKATARDVATQGIELFRAGKYEEALDKLKRAQELYDAPVHLLYMARCQEKLGQLVEAAENYRLLDRHAMPEGAPPAWLSAQEDGRKELASVEPRVPKLTVVLEPKDAPEPTLTIDGAPVSAAVVGIPRPINPGHHKVEVTAKGYEKAAAEVDVAEGESKDVTVKLSQGVTVSGGGSEPGAAQAKKSSKLAIGFMVGMRLAGAVPTGKLTVDPLNSGSEINTSDAFQPGGGVELHAGLRIARYFTPVLFFEGQKFGSGRGGGILGTEIKNPTGSSVGLGLIVGSPPGQMGGFGELDFAPSHVLSLTINPPDGSTNCRISATGGAVRFGGGGTFPVAKWLNLSPFALVTVAKPTKLETDGCSAVATSSIEGVRESDLRTHQIILLGVGGDLIFGSDR